MDQSAAIVREFQRRRDKVRRLKGYVIGLWLAGMMLLVFVLGVTVRLSSEEKVGLPILLTAFLGCALGAASGVLMLYAWAGLICPKCGKIPAKYLLKRKNVIFARRILTDPVQCPNCGVALK